MLTQESQEIEAGWTTLLDQASYTANKYFKCALAELKNSEMEFTAADVVALARIAAMDFHTSSMHLAAQKLVRVLQRENEDE